MYKLHLREKVEPLPVVCEVPMVEGEGGAEDGVEVLLVMDDAISVEVQWGE